MFEKRQATYEANSIARIDDLGSSISSLSSFLKFGPTPLQQPPQQQQSEAVNLNRSNAISIQKPSCDICRKTFNSDQAVRSHRKSSHGNRK